MSERVADRNTDMDPPGAASGLHPQHKAALWPQRRSLSCSQEGNRQEQTVNTAAPCCAPRLRRERDRDEMQCVTNSVSHP